MNYQITRGCRTKFRGAEEDWASTKEFFEAWHAEHDWLKCFVLVRDVNYTVDEKVDDVWQAHYEVSTYFGATIAMGGGSFRRENPDPWMNYECMVADIVLPYGWLNPESEEIEHGYIQVRLATALDKDTDMSAAMANLVQMARNLVDRYCTMIEAEYKGSHTTLPARNDEASFSVNMTIISSLTDEIALA